MGAKKGKGKAVELTATGRNKYIRSFPIAQAEDILSMKPAGWELADENYTFKDGHITIKSDTGVNQEAEESKTDKG